MNAEKRKNEKKYFEKGFFKLISKAVFREIMGKVRKEVLML